MFDEKPKMVDDPNKLGKKIANYWCGVKYVCGGWGEGIAVAGEGDRIIPDTFLLVTLVTG